MATTTKKTTAKKSTTAKKTSEKKEAAPVVVEAAPIAEIADATNEGTAAQYSADQVAKMIQEAVAKALAEAPKKEDAPATQAYSDGMVTLRFYDEINDANVIYLGDNGKYGQIIGKRWTGQVPKMAFIGDFRTPHIQKLLEDRNMIVISGLTDEERKLYGVDYVDGEFLDEKMYNAMLRMPEADLVETYTALCPEWKRMVAVRFAEAYEQGKLRITRDALVALNRESRKANKDFDGNDPRRKGDFQQIIDKMNIREQED